MQSKYAGLMLIVDSPQEKQAFIGTALAYGARAALPYLAKLGPLAWKGLRLGGGLAANAARSAGAWGTTKAIGNTAFNALMLASLPSSLAGTVSEGGRGLSQLAHGEGMEGLKSLGRSGLNAAMGLMTLNPISKGLTGLSRMARTSKDIGRNLISSPRMLAKHITSGMPAPAMRDPMIGSGIKDLFTGNKSPMRAPGATDVMTHRISRRLVLDPRVRSRLAQLSDSTISRMGNYGERIGGLGRKATIPGIAGMFGAPLLEARMPESMYEE